MNPRGHKINSEIQALREAVANYAGRLMSGQRHLRNDAVAGLTNAINNVPDGMANAALVGVNPVYGLYATMMGPFTGGILASTQLMLITTTAAASLTAGQALIGVPSEERASALFVMVILVGIILMVLGFLRLGQLTRFVSYSVTTGFLTGVSVLLVLSQLPTVTAYEASGTNRLSQTADLLANLNLVDLRALGLAILTLSLAILLPRTPLSHFGRLVAIVVPSVIVAVLGVEGIQTVRDVGQIPRGIPTPSLPSLRYAFDLLTGALAVAVVILVQGSGVSQSVPNPDGSRRRTSRDFIAQGAANVASGLFKGLPVGGSLSATALNVLSGARTRWAAIFAGLWMAIIVVVFPDLIAYVAMPTLGALLILAGSSSIKPSDIRSVWRAGWLARLAGGTTFLAMMFLPIQAAVGIGVVLSAMLYVIRSSTAIVVVELVERPDGRIEEREAPARLPDNAVTVLDVYGDLFFAAARTLERLLPRPEGAHRPVVILRLRGETNLGATLLDVLASYASNVNKAGGRLYLTGINARMYHQVLASGKLHLSGPVRAFELTPIRGEATRRALADAQAWLAQHDTDASSDEPGSDDGSADGTPPTSGRERG